MSELLRVGVIGCGNVVARGHAPALLEIKGVKVLGVADPAEENAGAVIDLYTDVLIIQGVDAAVVIHGQVADAGERVVLGAFGLTDSEVLFEIEDAAMIAVGLQRTPARERRPHLIVDG